MDTSESKSKKIFVGAWQKFRETALDRLQEDDPAHKVILELVKAAFYGGAYSLILYHQYALSTLSADKAVEFIRNVDLEVMGYMDDEYASVERMDKADEVERVQKDRPREIH